MTLQCEGRIFGTHPDSIIEDPDERFASLLKLDFDGLCFRIKGVFDKLGDKFKVVCVTPDLKDSVDEMARSQRDHVVMVRVDEETRRKLDCWVEAGAVKSRSEAAALFIREGLGVRADELARLKGALSDVERARDELRRQARKVFGEDPPAS